MTQRAAATALGLEPSSAANQLRVVSAPAPEVAPAESEELYRLRRACKRNVLSSTVFGGLVREMY